MLTDAEIGEYHPQVPALGSQRPEPAWDVLLSGGNLPTSTEVVGPPGLEPGTS